jgi:hypothetical protein
MLEILSCSSRRQPTAHLDAIKPEFHIHRLAPARYKSRAAQYLHPCHQHYKNPHHTTPRSTL